MAAARARLARDGTADDSGSTECGKRVPETVAVAAVASASVSISTLPVVIAVAAIFATIIVSTAVTPVAVAPILHRFNVRYLRKVGYRKRYGRSRGE
jgi:hypothetical protein